MAKRLSRFGGGGEGGRIDPDVEARLAPLEEAARDGAAVLTEIRASLTALEGRVADLEAAPVPPPPIPPAPKGPLILDQVIRVREDHAPGPVGSIVAERADRLEIVSGNDAGAWALSDAGALTLTQSLDYETTPIYLLVVRAINAYGEDTASVNVEVTDVAEPGTPPDEPPPPPTIPPVGDKVYAIGPGMPYASFAALPDPIEPGATLLIHPRGTHYKEKFAVNVDDLTLEGVIGPNGERPVIDGAGAKAAQSHVISAHSGGGTIWQQRGLIACGRFGRPWPWRPKNLTIRNLEIRGANGGTEFVSESGAVLPYWDSAGGIYLHGTDGVTVQNVVAHDCGHGIFGASGGDLDLATLLNDVLIEDCVLHNNGNVGNASFQSHNSYLEALRITYRRCRYGSSRAGSGGGMLKDRSAFAVVEDCHFEGLAGRMLDLVEPEEGRPVLTQETGWDTTEVRRCTLVRPHGGAWAVIAFGGDFGVPAWIRKLLRLTDVTVAIEGNRATTYWMPFIRSQYEIAPRIECRKVRITRTLAPGASQLPEFRLLESPNATMEFYSGEDASTITPAGWTDGGIVVGREHVGA